MIEKIWSFLETNNYKIREKKNTHVEQNVHKAKQTTNRKKEFKHTHELVELNKYATWKNQRSKAENHKSRIK